MEIKLSGLVEMISNSLSSQKRRVLVHMSKYYKHEQCFFWVFFFENLSFQSGGAETRLVARGGFRCPLVHLKVGSGTIDTIDASFIAR